MKQPRCLPQTLAYRLEALYQCDIHWAIRTDWGGGYTAILGDVYNGKTDEEVGLVSFEEAVNYLWQIAQKRFPNAQCFKI